jgi:hypothetical protein
MRKADHDEPTYEGRAGRTRREVVHFTTAEGIARSAAVTRVVNLGTDPQLRDALLGGSLHRAEGGEDLAIAVIVHDPGARRVVIHLPEPIRHHELAERTRWLTLLGEDRESPLPRYAQEPRVAVGLAQLRAILSEPTGAAVARREGQLAQKEENVAKREELVISREQRLRERAEQITRREDEIRERAEENEAGQRDLAMRESELESRLLALVDRERALAEKERVVAEREKSSAGLLVAPLPDVPKEPIAEEGTSPRKKTVSQPPAARAPSVPPPAPPTAAPRGTLAPPSPIAAIVPDDDVEEIDDLDPVSTSPGVKSHASGRFAPPAAREPEAIEVRDSQVVEQVPNDAVEELVDEEDLEEEVDDAMLSTREDVTGLHTAPERNDEEPMLVGTASEEGVAMSADLSGPRTAIASVVARDDDRVPVDVRERELGWKVGEGVELFVRTDAARVQALGSPPELDLLVQLPPADAATELRPLVLVTLLDAARARLARVVLDPRDAAERLLLEAMRRKLDVKVILHDGTSRLSEVRVVVPRELNVARILERSSRLRAEGGLPPDAKERAAELETPLPDGHVLLGDKLDRAADAGALRLVIRDVADAITTERLDDAIVYASVPKDTIDATVARVIERALTSGLALPSQLTERAVATGLATDVGELVSRQISAFRTTTQAEGSGLSPEAIAENWERLLASATDNEIALDSETHDLAHEAIRRVRGSTPSVPPGGEVDPARIAEAGIPELLLMLDHPRFRRAAAISLAERAGAEHVEALCKAVRKMPRHEVVRVVPAIAKIGEEAGDALIDGLSAKKTFVRHAFAIALGHLKLRRAVVPLLHVLREEQSEVWKDVARVVGTFGNASLRAITRQTGDAKTDERTIRALAHLANHGCEDALVQMTKESDARAARLAVHALAQRESAREWEDQVLGKRSTESTEATLLFARRFYEELEGKAPDAELALGTDPE